MKFAGLPAAGERTLACFLERRNRIALPVRVISCAVYTPATPSKAPLTAAALHVRVATGVLLAVLAVLVAGCGAESYENNPRPPVTLSLSVFVGEDEIAYSPRTFGAGPVRFIATNQTGAQQLVTFATDRDERRLEIPPHQTAKVEMDVEPGILSIDADRSAADPVEIEVGPRRPSAQQTLDQP